VKKFLIILALICAAVFTIAWVSSRWIRVYNHVLYFENLPPHLEGFRILQISDLHSDSDDMNIDIWRHIDNLEFDMVAITGDIILGRRQFSSGPITELDPHREQFARLAAKVPTFFVEGNHESHNFPQVAALMDELGINFLRNDAVYHEFNGGIIEIIGLADNSTLQRMRFAGFNELFNESENFQLVLMHQPQLFDLFNESGINLALAGHTHGGQIRLPFVPTIYAPGQGFWPRYGAGFYRHNDAVLYVSRGLGTTYFPLRFWNRPEIAVIELRAK